MNYDFRKDIVDGENAEKIVADMFRQKCSDIATIDFNKDNRFDLLIRLKNGKSVTAEVKYDQMIQDTGNFAFETFCRGKSSGLDVTLADLFIVYCKDNKEHAYTFKTDYLKRMVHNGGFSKIHGGDVNSKGESVTEMVLIPKRYIIDNASDLAERESISLDKVAR